MKGVKLITRVGNGMYAMLYYDSDLVAFFNTNQEAWIFFRNAFFKRPIWPTAVSIVSIVVTDHGGHDSLEVVNMQTFELEEGKDVYTGAVTYDPEILENVKLLVEKDWRDSITK